jgi:thiamine kinase-like enzyme
VRPRSLAQSLHRLHDALGKMLGSSDRRLLTTVLASGAAMAPKQHVLHGSPHDRNILVVNGRPLFIDFETTCVGPLEWDLAHLDDDVAEHDPDGLDFGLLARCRTLVSAKTAVWCRDKAANSSEMSWHAEHHLNIVKQSLA